MKKVSLFFALLLGLTVTAFAQTPAVRWQTQELDARLMEGANTVRMNDGSVLRFTIRGEEVFNLSVQSGRNRVVFEENDEAPAGAPTIKCPNKWDLHYCYYSTKDKMLVCFCGSVFSNKPSSDPTAATGRILLARLAGVPTAAQ